MAEPDKDQKTQEATPKRKEQLREEGKLAKSADVGAAAVLGAMLLTLAFSAADHGRVLLQFATRSFRLQDSQQPLEALAALQHSVVQVALPAIVVTAVIALIAGMVQTGGLFRPALLLPKPERFNPWPQLKRIVPGKESALELGKQLLKILVLAAVATLVLKGRLRDLVRLASVPPLVAARQVGQFAGQLLLYGSLAFAAVATLDYWLARRRFREDAKMSEQETRDERRQEEGDPHVRRQLRQKMRELASRRTVADTCQATVLVTNPTHVAVALRYDPARDAVPVLLAKGVEKLALRMRQAARGAGVPIVEQRPFARALYKHGKLGAAIPADLFEPAAEVIAFVLRLRAGGQA